MKINIDILFKIINPAKTIDNLEPRSSRNMQVCQETRHIIDKGFFELSETRIYYKRTICFIIKFIQ